MNDRRSIAASSHESESARGGRVRAALVALLVSQAMLLLAIVWVLRGNTFGPAAAAADDRIVDGGVSNVGPRQRKSMLESLAAIEKRLVEIDARLAEGVLRVELTDDDDRR